jgi:DNA-directed RNA polymerase specialized sigma24 family protein
MASSHTRFVELEWIMAMPLTRDEQLVLRHLLSGESSEEIAATLGWPLHAVRDRTHMLITWVLNELGASGRTPSEYLPAPPPPVGS